MKILLSILTVAALLLYVGILASHLFKAVGLATSARVIQMERCADPS